MATTYEYIMGVIGEECGEIIVRLEKIRRFGPDDIEPGQPFTALERLNHEIHDLLGAIKENVERGHIPAPGDEAKVLAKQIKILKTLDYARSKGTVIDFDDGSLIDDPSWDNH